MQPCYNCLLNLMLRKPGFDIIKRNVLKVARAPVVSNVKETLNTLLTTVLSKQEKENNLFWNTVSCEMWVVLPTGLSGRGQWKHTLLLQRE